MLFLLKICPLGQVHCHRKKTSCPSTTNQAFLLHTSAQSSQSLQAETLVKSDLVEQMSNTPPPHFKKQMSIFLVFDFTWGFFFGWGIFPCLSDFRFLSDVLQCLREDMRRKSPNKLCCNDWVLHRSNDNPYDTFIVQWFLQETTRVVFLIHYIH